ncbi:MULTISPECIES: TonB-dependent receptor [Dyella]|uniref:TonB-dependent receptor n=2 Tax=Dyella TaxID=231454 RepID=A0A4R0YIF8_9GAMM|nr:MULTISPECIES: TonB-dependent receptor [Dyella]TBR36689.1 TonB-dependent receptor [Dyella terrae]TCI08220.1 TonB-dependent receptor [Dyella soli]
MKRNKLALALAGLLFSPVGIVLAQTAPPADQNPPPSEQQAKQLQTITVTGSALPRVDVETPSPVTVITAQQIERSGLKTVTDVVRAISADNSGSIPTAFTAGFAAGSAGVALRGLTVNSTLVLVDGRRSAAYALADDGQRSFVDLNTIPVNAIERIDVLKDGASSLYGADAIAGVVNIILKPSYKGGEATAEIGTSQHGGGTTKRFTGLLGGGDLQKDGHNAYLSVEYQKDDPIKVKDRGFPYNTADLTSIGGNNLTGGQPSQNSGSIYGTVTPGTLARPGDLTSGIPLDGAVSQPLNACGPGTNLVTNDPANPGSYCAQNFAKQYGQIAPEQERLGVYGRFTVKLGDDTKAYLGVSYYQNEVQTQAAPTQIQSTTPRNTTSIALPPTLPDGSLNPNNPFAAQGQYALINYAFPGTQFGALDNTNHNLRVQGGVTGRAWGWDYDTAVVLNHTWLDINNYGFLNYNQLISDITNGTYNFINPSANSRAVMDALTPTLSKKSTTDLYSYDFRASRELWDMPGGPMGLGVGVDWRYEKQHDPDLNPDLAAQGLGIAHTIGRRNVEGAYAELLMPLLQSLEMDLSARFDHYSDFGNNVSPKVGFKWKPIDMLALRGTFSKGFRAPSFAENGSSAAEGFTTYTPPADFQAAHGNNGYVQPYPLAFLTSANPNVRPEKSKSYTFGIVLQPWQQVSLSLDYYNIKKTGVISQQDPSSVLAAYYAGEPLPNGSYIIADNPDPQFPNALARPVVVSAPYVNQNQLATQGLDADLRGDFKFNSVEWISEITATQIFEWNLTTEDGTVQRFVGTHGPYVVSSGAGTPRTRGSWANTLLWNKLTVTGTLYYTSGLSLTAPDITDGCFSTNTNTGAPFPADCRMSSITTFDLTGSYDFNDHVSIFGSILNAFDRKPPLDPLNYAALNYNPTYGYSGIVGRFFNLGVKVKM